MSKRLTGEFDMTNNERRLWLEAIVSGNLANHYQKMADVYTEKATRDQALFWDTVKQRPLPKSPCQFSVKDGDRKIVIEVISKEERKKHYFQKPNPKKVD